MAVLQAEDPRAGARQPLAVMCTQKQSLGEQADTWSAKDQFDTKCSLKVTIYFVI